MNIAFTGALILVNKTSRCIGKTHSLKIQVRKHLFTFNWGCGGEREIDMQTSKGEMAPKTWKVTIGRD